MIRKALFITLEVAAVGATLSEARAQVPLSAYQDANGFINVQDLTCKQLASTFQEDTDLLAAWYNGLAQTTHRSHGSGVASTNAFFTAKLTPN